MGTNFYLVKKIDNAIIREVQKMVDDEIRNSDSCEISLSSVESYINKQKLRQHLGKRSAGWQFLWEKHPEYDDNLISIVNYLMESTRKGYMIMDEYNQEYTLEQFINEEVGESMYGGEVNGKHYYNHSTAPAEYGGSYISPEWISKDGLRFIEGDFS